MSSDTVKIETIFHKEYYLITGSLVDNEMLPAEVFMYENTGTEALGDYYGVCSFSELTSTKILNTSAIPIFRNKYVRSSKIKIKAYSQDEVTMLINHITVSLKNLIAEIQNQETNTVLIHVG